MLLAFPSGGYFVADWGVASIVLLAILAVTVLSLEVSLGGRWAGLALGGLAGLGIWQGISSAWAYQPSSAIDAMNQTLLYAAAFALVLVGVRRASDLDALLWSALAGSAIVTAYGLGSRLLPGTISGDEAARLSNPITYWNGLGALIAFGTLLAVGLGSQGRSPRWARALAAGLVPMFLVALLLTYSRGAAAALTIGLALLLALAPGRLETLATLAPSAAISIPLLATTNGEKSIAALTGVLPPHGDSGMRILLILIATMVASAATSIGSSALLAALPARHRRTSGMAVAACALIGVAALLIVKMPDAGAAEWTKQQFNSFKSYDAGARAEAESVSDRLAVAAGSGRWQNWGVAADEFQESPIAGTGAGDYVYFWQQKREIDLTVVNAHSVYLETLGETGVIGLMLLLCPAAALLIAFVLYLRRRPPPAEARNVALALSAAGLVGIHAAGDWDWQLPAIVLPAMALAAGALKVASLGDRISPPASAGTRGTLAVGAILASVMVAGPTASASALTDAHDRASHGELQSALERAEAAARLSPQDPAPRLLQANLLSDLGRPAQADAAFAAAVARSPRDWEIFADWSAALSRRRDARAALLAATHALTLNPREKRTRYLLESDE